MGCTHPAGVGKSVIGASLVDCIEKSLERINQDEDTVRALLPESTRRERLMREARILEESYPDSIKRPPLYGVLLGVKDLFSAEGFETRAGSKLPADVFIMPESTVVSQLKNAGALVLGKTVSTEFAFFQPGPTSNPWDSSLTPGGSSSGSAAAVAAGFCTLALGTQTMGSISRPASYCGISGWKPSYGRTSPLGVVPFSPSLDHVGLLAPDIAGILPAARLICNDWDEQRYSREKTDAKQTVLVVPEGEYLSQANPEALVLFENMIERLIRSGFIIKRIQAF
ncbi:MAG: amidase, partial [Treponema sp.]|nr:amidase [Treponema sp.]